MWASASVCEETIISLAVLKVAQVEYATFPFSR